MNETIPNLRGYLNRIHTEDLRILEKKYSQQQKILKTLKYWVCSTAVMGLLVSIESDYAFLDVHEIDFFNLFIKYLSFVFLPTTIIMICALQLTSYQFKSKLKSLCVMDKTPFQLLKKEIKSYFKEENKSYNFIKAKE
ncbi:MAG: hypothetical protein AAFQ20_00705 [Bacteroidota bacterium]